ncbi:hypothetical protein ACU8OL_20725 [Rhizobium leguminosarum]
MDYDLGYIDLEQRTLQTTDNSFGTRLSPMSEKQSVTYVFGMGNLETGAGEGIRTLDPNLGKRKITPFLHLVGVRSIPPNTRENAVSAHRLFQPGITLMDSGEFSRTLETVTAR